MSVHELNLKKKAKKTGKKDAKKSTKNVTAVRPFFEKKSLKIADSLSVLQEKSRFSIKS